MDVGYSIHQVSGPKVRETGVNQSRNSGGEARGFCADIEACDHRGVLMTTPTRETLAQVDADVERWLLRFNDAQTDLVVPLN